MALPNDIYGRAITLSSDGVTDTYTVTDSANNILTLAFPIGTSQVQVYTAIDSMAPGVNPVLAMAIAQNIASFQVALNNFVGSKYSETNRMNFIGIYINAQQNNLTNRMAYVAQLFPWQNNVIQYATSYIASVEALTDPSVVAATTWNFASLIATDPCITPAAALQISN